MSEAPSSVPKRYEPDAMERRVIQRWRRDDVFGQQVAAGRTVWEDSGRKDAHRFIFLEGPPTANGLPHPGHVLTRTLKDAVCRFHAMHGKWVPRKAGWDCHGLPVEIEVQKELGIERAEDIAPRLQEFLAKCKESVFRYKKDWEEMSERVGFWLDYDDPYVTMDDGYIESVWWSLKRLFEKGLLVKSYKVVPYSPVTKTTYSSHEVAQGYRDVTDTSVFVKFHLLDDPDGARVLSWTTTPWTLPGNVALAVGEDLDYVKVRVTEASGNTHAAVGEVLVLAKETMKAALRDHVDVLAEMKGKDLVGMRYEPLFPGAVDETREDAAPWPVDASRAWTVAAADFVTVEDGTGVVHTAVMYGEDDFRLGQEIGLPAQHTVDLDGRFVDAVPGGLAGQYVKDDATETAILEYLRTHDLLYRDEPYEHSYPHCWRTDTPLLYYALESWFIQMSRLRDELLANNDAIGWVPDSIKEGRMGDWLRNVKDWAFSRSRYWGTPLPVWTCTDCGHHVCIGSRAELRSHGIDVLELHRPHVDVPIQCPSCGGDARREPYVIDVWYDSGASQFAQWKATSLDDEALREHWPIDFIAEGLDQTRGWFYSLLAASTALGATLEDGGKTEKAARKAGLFQGPPYRNCVVNGLILAEDGQKMSKSKRNYVPPDQVFAHVGADATRWYLLAATAPWQDKRFYEDAVRDTFGKFFSTLWNTFLFWKQYADLDGWKPDLATLDHLHETTSPLDRWLLSRLEATVAEAEVEGQRYHLHKACRAIESFVLDDLSNWWVRRSRDRFWQEKGTPDKWSAHSTLWWALHSVSRLVAPFAPFMVEVIWEHVRLDRDPASVHLARYPEAGPRESELETTMQTVRDLCEAGRALRSKIGIPTRHPLGGLLVAGAGLPDWATTLVGGELNVKKVETPGDASEARRWVAKPDRSALGPTFKADAPKVAEAIEALDGDSAHAALAAGNTVGVNVAGAEHALSAEHITFEQEDRPDWASAEVGEAVLAFWTQRSQALLDEAFAREVIRRVQDLRKELDLPVDAAIGLTLAGAERASGFAELIAEECRASSVEFVKVLEKPHKVWDVDGVAVSCLVEGEGIAHSSVEAA